MANARMPAAVVRSIEAHLSAIAAEFRPGARLTLLVRNPTIAGDADAVFTTDTLPEAISALNRRLALALGES